MVNGGKEIDIDIRNFESNLSSTPWAKKKINFSSLSNHCVFYSVCYCFSIKFLNGISRPIASNY